MSPSLKNLSAKIGETKKVKRKIERMNLFIRYPKLD